MKCPICHQGFSKLTESGKCPGCGAALAASAGYLMRIYVVMGALLLSTVMYGAVAVFLNTMHREAPGVSAQVPQILLYAALAMVPVMLVTERALLGRGTAQGVMSGAVIVGAMAESIAIMGLVAFFLGADLRFFAQFLGLSIVCFVYLLVRLPQYVRTISTSEM